jgi:Tfp pilus assembly protein PilN
MIKINLLPENLRKEESPFAKIALGFKGRGKSFRNLAIAAVFVLVAIHITLFSMGMKSSAAFQALTQKNNQLLPRQREYEALKAEVGLTSRKAAAIDALMANRFSWAKKLNDLGDSITQGIWLTDLSYEEKLTEIPAQAKTPARKANVGYLNISGYASSMGEQGTALIGKFITSMKENPSFFNDFSEIKLESIKTERYMDQEVMNFKITCQFKT